MNKGKNLEGADSGRHFVLKINQRDFPLEIVRSIAIEFVLVCKFSLYISFISMRYCTCTMHGFDKEILSRSWFGRGMECK